MSEKIWYKAARMVVNAGNYPFPINETVIELLKILITDDQARFIQIFRKPSLSLEQIKQKTNLNDVDLEKMLNDLMDGGIVVGTKSRSTGKNIYRLMGPFPGIFEFTFMKGGTSEREQKLAKLFDKIFKDMSDRSQKSHDLIVKMYKDFPPIARVVPVEEFIDVGQEEVLPCEDVTKLLDDYDVIAVTHCYCRHQKDLLGEPCKVTKEKHNCILLGKSAKFAIEHDFTKPISKENTIQIFHDAEDSGLVHKIFHVHLNPEKEIEGICSCCKCCCGIFQMYYSGTTPYHTLTSYLAKIIENNCVGCGTCVEKCPMEAIELINAVAKLNSDMCIGCGVCAHHCPENAIKLERTGPRNVLVPPRKINA